MSNELVTANDLSQALSRSLLDVAMGRETNRSKLQKQIDISDALNRRMQTQINTMKVMIEAKKSGIDFALAMRDIRAMMKESGEDIEAVTTTFDDDKTKCIDSNS